MPNWCNNELRVSGPVQDLEAFKRHALGHNPWDKLAEYEPPSLLNFHSLVPVPPDLLKTEYGQLQHDWEVQHWGARWGACNILIMDEDHEYIVYTFDTSWNPPVEFIKNVRQQWLTLTFILIYGGPAVGYKGICKGHGEHFENHRIEY